MTDELLDYYNRELIYLRGLGAEFGEKYPQHAAQLMAGSGRYQDPHVERLLEGFAFLAARIHRKIDDDFPEITEALFNTIYPHFVRPIPSMSIVEFRVDPRRRKLTSAFNVPRHSILLSSPPLEGFRCKFRTCYDTVISPCRILEAQWRTPERFEPPLASPESAAACRLLLGCDPDVTFASLRMDSLRLYLDGPNLVNSLYELLMNNCRGIVIRNPDDPAAAPLRLPASALRPMGFSESEAMLEYSRRSFSGYQLLQEYFAFPEKFFFLELGGLGKLAEKGFSSRAEIIFLISRYERVERHHTLEQGVTPATFRLNCAPVINLFPLTAEPIHIDQTRYEYPVIPDRRRRNAYEVFSIDQVSSVNTGAQRVIEFEPLYASHYRRSGNGSAFWQAHRRPSIRENDNGTDMWISLLDLDGRSARPGVETLTVRCSATNRDLVSLPGFDSVEFELEGASPVTSIVPIRKATETLRPPIGKGQLWRLVSHLSLNYLSLVERREALQTILRQYNFAEYTHIARQINGISALTSKRHFARVVSENGISFARGTRVEMELDETHFAEGGAYLFGAVLEYFLGQYTTVNSFSQLVLRTRQRKDALREWAPRAGHKVLL